MFKFTLIILSIFSLNTHAADVSMTLTEYLAQPANPMKIDISTDASQSSTLFVTAAAGGILKLKTKSGDIFTLVIPPKALQADTEITMMAISKLVNNSLAIKTNISGVDLSPEGLEFLKPASLTITTAKPIDPSIVVALTTNNDGTEASLAFIDPKNTDPNSATLNLFHFSTYSIFGSQTARESISKAFNSLTSNRIQSYLADQMAKQKNGQAVDKDFLWDSIKEAYDKVLHPQVNNIESCAGGIDVIRNFLLLTRQGQLLGVNTDYIIDDKVFEIARAKTGNKCKEQAYKACYEDHRPFDLYYYTLSYLRQNQLMGVYNDPIDTILSELTLKCMNFDVEVFSTLSMPKEAGVSVTAMGKASVSLPNIFEAIVSKGIMQVKKMEFNPEGINCSVKSLINPEEKLVIIMGMNDMRFDQSLGVSMSPLTPKSNAVFTCNDEDGNKFDIPLPATSPSDNTSFWGGMFQAFHSMATKNEYNVKKSRYEFYKWNVLYGELFAEKHYKRTFEEMDEETDFYIYHRPKP